MERVTAERFWQAFRDAWQLQLEASTGAALLHQFSSNIAWTNFMLLPGGMLYSVCKQLDPEGQSLKYVQEWYTVDALLVGGKNLYEERGSYPSEVHVLIEHENNYDVETEMWKLLHWRCPLKVLIFYDWTEEEKEGRPRRVQWAKDKIDRLVSMLQAVHQFWPEPRETEYLMIIGERTRAEEISWRHQILSAELP